MKRWALALAFGLSMAHGALAQGFDMGLLAGQKLVLPQGDIGRVVVLVSDAGGWGAWEDTETAELSAHRAAVIGIDLPSWLRTLDAVPGDCVYTIADIESLSGQIQRDRGTTSYASPLLAGRGAGGAMVLAMMAQTPDATLSGAIAVDPDGGTKLSKPLCTEARRETDGGKTRYQMNDGPLRAPLTVVFTPEAPQVGRQHVDTLKAVHPDILTRDLPGPAADALKAAIAEGAATAADPLDLPLTILPAKPTHELMAVIYSGDGGWRDIDKQIGGYLQSQGVPVVGVDALRYFWHERTPQETADDLARIIRSYHQEWGVTGVVLIGYSFGADILPASYNLLPEAERSLIRQVTLLAPTREASYEISVTGWLGVASGSGISTLKEMERIAPSKLLCAYGEKEDDSPCPELVAKGAEVIRTGGGHHFDGDYEALGQQIIDGADRRAGR